MVVDGLLVGGWYEPTSKFTSTCKWTLTRRNTIRVAPMLKTNGTRRENIHPKILRKKHWARLNLFYFCININKIQVQGETVHPRPCSVHLTLGLAVQDAIKMWTVLGFKWLAGLDTVATFVSKTVQITSI